MAQAATGGASWREELRTALTDYILPMVIAVGLMFFGIGMMVVTSLLLIVGAVVGVALGLIVGIIGGLALTFSMAVVRLAFTNLLFGLITMALAGIYLFRGQIMFVILGAITGLLIGWVVRSWSDISVLANTVREHATERKFDDKSYRILVLRPGATYGFEAPLWQSAVVWVIVVVVILIGGLAKGWWGLVWALLAASSLWSSIWWLFLEADSGAMLFGQLVTPEQLRQHPIGQRVLQALERVRQLMRVHFMRWAQ